jgi:hypothetical protein
MCAAARRTGDRNAIVTERASARRHKERTELLSEQEPSIGRVVHYVLDSGPYKGEHRPAFIVRCWAADLVNLQVFPDSNAEGTSNDCLPVPLWATSRKYDATGELPGTWHWPDRV